MGEWKFFETNKFKCMTQIGTGIIIAYEKSAKISRRMLEMSVHDKVNDFPHTDEDFIIMAARKACGLRIGV